MAEVKVSQDELLLGFLEVFRRVGYDGASMEALANAAGLKKSSLYHRFPGGKKQMAKEVLKFAGHWVGVHVTSILKADGDPRQRLKSALKNIDKLYSGGQDSCILRALSMDTGLDLFSQLIHGAFGEWINGFMKMAKDFGASPSMSKRMAEDIVIKIQGSLIVARGTGNKAMFKRTLKEVENNLIGIN